MGGEELSLWVWVLGVQLKLGAAFQPDVAAKAVYDSTWNSKTRLQVDTPPHTNSLWW